MDFILKLNRINKNGNTLVQGPILTIIYFFELLTGLLT